MQEGGTEGYLLASWPPRPPVDDIGPRNGCNDDGESSHCRSRVRSLMEKGNLIPQSLQIQSRVRLHFGSYPVKKGDEGGRGGEGMGCKHKTHLVLELGEVGEGEVEDGVLAADEDGPRIRIQDLEEVGGGPPRRRRRKPEPQICERKRRTNIAYEGTSI